MTNSVLLLPVDAEGGSAINGIGEHCGTQSMISRGSTALRVVSALLRGFCLLATLLAAADSTARADVTDAGTYQTSVIVEVPPFHGIAPIIRLGYDSNAGDGPLGIGWSLSIGPQIVRTSRFMGAPRFDATDQLWLDGVELLPCAEATLSASCRAGGTHTTRIETYTRIRLNKASNTWMVWRPNGTRLVMSPKRGNTGSPDTTLRWLLTEVIDTHGNQVHYNWICGATSTCYISDIYYGEGKSCTATPPTGPDSPGTPIGSPLAGANVHFFWEGRPDPPSIAMSGTLEETDSRLRAIQVSEGWRPVRVYQINYVPELSVVLEYKRFRSTIESIQVFGNDAVVDAGGNVISGTAWPERRTRLICLSIAGFPIYKAAVLP
jgi:virulence plasmid B protein